MQIIELCDKRLCTGCGACDNICPKNAISMEFDEEGFLFPIINQDICVKCGLCTKTCPIIARPNREVYKPPIAIYAGYIKDRITLKKSASGGAFPAFANYFYGLENGMVAAAAFDEHLNLRHLLSSTKSDLPRFQGSKYLQSEIGHIYVSIRTELANSKTVLFVGTPCQVAGLKSYLGKDYENLFTIDLVCHGVPSPVLFHSYLNQIGISTRKEYRNFYFRNRRNSAYFQHSIQNKLGLFKKISPADHSFICAYLKGWLHRESCYHCPFSAIPRQGDCTIADFWGILLGKVHFNGNPQNGVSMIMINNPKGQSVFQQVNHSFFFEEKTLDEAMIDNHNLFSHDLRPDIRDIVYSELLKQSPAEFMVKFDLKLPLQVSIWKKIKSRIIRLFAA